MSLPISDPFVQVYRQRAADYHALIAAEDTDGNLLPALESITPFAGRRVLDVGSGSGRIPLLIKNLGCTVLASEIHNAMLLEQSHQMELENKDWALLQADARQLPLPNAWADIAIAGWAIGHFTGWFANDWQSHAKRALAEMQRATKPGGALIILETMGTATDHAAPPNASLAAYYAWLEHDLGFTRQVVATDYDFGSVARSAELCGSFFGPEMAELVRANNWSRVPEWTGIWSRALTKP
jgi:SAM-dependent methyltransferase